MLPGGTSRGSLLLGGWGGASQGVCFLGGGASGGVCFLRGASRGCAFQGLCFPGGGVLPGKVCASQGVCASGWEGVLPGGCLPGGCVSQDALRQIPPCEQND